MMTRMNHEHEGQRELLGFVVCGLWFFKLRDEMAGSEARVPLL